MTDQRDITGQREYAEHHEQQLATPDGSISLRAYPWGTEAQPFNTKGDPEDEYLYVGSGAGIVMLCERGHIRRWRNAIGLSPGEARQLGAALFSMAWQAEQTTDPAQDGDIDEEE